MAFKRISLKCDLILDRYLILYNLNLILVSTYCNMVIDKILFYRE